MQIFCEFQLAICLRWLQRPLLFLIYMNDICNASIISEFILFADDTNVFYSDSELPVSVNVINNEMKNLSEWFLANRLTININ